MTSDIDKWAQSLSTVYSNFSKPLLDLILFSRELSGLVGYAGPATIVFWYAISGILLKVNNYL